MANVLSSLIETYAVFEFQARIHEENVKLPNKSEFIQYYLLMTATSPDVLTKFPDEKQAHQLL